MILSQAAVVELLRHHDIRLLQKKLYSPLSRKQKSGVADSDRKGPGVYIQDMADVRTAKLYAGLLAVGDAILEVNNAKVAGLSLPALRNLIVQAETLSIRLLQQRRPLR